MEFSQIYTLIVVVVLVVFLYREIVHPSISFFGSVVLLMVGGVLSPYDLLNALSNPQIALIFLLILVTAGIRGIFGPGLFSWLFTRGLRPRTFLARMMLFVSGISAFLNNTPIVAFMMPYVREWCRKNGYSLSRFLIPLSFATILGGMITVAGTSTSLLLNGLIQGKNLPMLGFEDFLFLGLLVTIFGWIYLYFIGYHLLPDHPGKLDDITGNLTEYIVETEVPNESSLRGKSVREAGLRNLQDLFLIEILRDGQVISPVGPEEYLKEGDRLFFSGNTQSIHKLISENTGLKMRHSPSQGTAFQFTEAVVPANSDLIGRKVNRSDFRNRFNASIVAIHRDGKRISGSIGEAELAAGDFLLLVSGDGQRALSPGHDLLLLSMPKGEESPKPIWIKISGMASILLLLAGIAEWIPLFTACLVVLSFFIFTRILRRQQIRQEIDLGLLLILVSSVAIGTALDRSGAAQWVATLLLKTGESLGPLAALTALFLSTTLLTSLISNAAAVAIVFPIALSMAAQLGMNATPFFVAIAFAASGDFITPIGYQTNLMVYGPGGYSFRDFAKVGIPLTLIYAVTCLTFIAIYYSVY
ncbi:MAG: SLC13 family permease [Cyclobacteriaceae bacterium]|jgi:di/tricarboxylate transporter